MAFFLNYTKLAIKIIFFYTKSMEKRPNNLSMGNKRNHKIMITDVAIEKVPYIEYKNIPEKEYQKAAVYFLRNCYRANIIYQEK